MTCQKKKKNTMLVVVFITSFHISLSNAIGDSELSITTGASANWNTKNISCKKSEERPLCFSHKLIRRLASESCGSELSVELSINQYGGFIA